MAVDFGRQYPPGYLVQHADQQINAVRDLLRSRPASTRKIVNDALTANVAMIQGQMPTAAQQAFAFGVLTALNTVFTELHGMHATPGVEARLYAVGDTLSAVAVQFYTGRSPFRKEDLEH